MRSAKVADPLKLYEVCPMTDAASAIVLCREEILRDQPDKPQVYVTATQMGTGTCVERAHDGEQCVTNTCYFPARCDHEICQLPNGALCE